MKSTRLISAFQSIFHIQYSIMKLVITGASGRMGRMLIEAALATDGITLHGALDSASSAFLGKDAGEFLGQTTGVLISNDAATVLADADCMIDFTRPEATLDYLNMCIAHSVNAVIGTTGFDDAGKAAIHAASNQIGVVFAANMGTGVNVTLKLLEMAAKILNTGYDIEIIEAHHRLKVDAPSGTAEGVTGVREDSTIGFSTIRGGDVIGDHTVMFLGMGERIEITHKSSSRMTYATGAMRAAQFLNQNTAGFYDMQDVLGLKD